MRPLGVIGSGLLAASLLAPAPAVAQNRVEQQMFIDLRELQEEERQLLLAVNALSDQLKTVTGKVDAEANARSKAFADLQTLISNANSGVSALQENVRDNKVQVQKLTQEVEAIKKGVDMLAVMVTQALAQMPANAPPSDPNAPPGSNPSAAAAPSVPASCKDYYERALGDYAVAQYDLAIQGYQEFLKQCPTAPDAPQVQYQIGQSYFMVGKFQEAMTAYGVVISKYKSTGADAVPDAYYKQGDTFEQLKQRDQAVANYQLVRKEYADSSAAVLATQALKRLGVLK
jgi:TolA-binding protein